MAAVDIPTVASNPNPTVEAVMNELLAHYAIQAAPFKGLP